MKTIGDIIGELNRKDKEVGEKRKFTVDLRKVTVDTLTVEVEARSPDEAREIALQRNEDGVYAAADWDGDWEPVEACGVYEEK
jgi:hypothetical protein